MSHVAQKISSRPWQIGLGVCHQPSLLLLIDACVQKDQMDVEQYLALYRVLQQHRRLQQQLDILMAINERQQARQQQQRALAQQQQMQQQQQRTQQHIQHARRAAEALSIIVQSPQHTALQEAATFSKLCCTNSHIRRALLAAAVGQLHMDLTASTFTDTAGDWLLQHMRLMRTFRTPDQRTWEQIWRQEVAYNPCDKLCSVMAAAEAAHPGSVAVTCLEVPAGEHNSNECSQVSVLRSVHTGQ
jgi:hypothetical protein